MKKLIAVFIFLFPIWACLAQTNSSLQVLVLTPRQVIYDKNFEKEITKLNDEIIREANQASATLSGLNGNGLSENRTTMRKGEIAYLQKMNFFKEATHFAFKYFIYSCSGKYSDCLIIPKEMTCDGTVNELKLIAEKERFRYVINFPVVDFFREDSANKARVRLQLYDQFANSVLLDNTFIGRWENSELVFPCKSGSLTCTIQNAVALAIRNAYTVILKNDTTSLTKKTLEDQRALVLMNNFYRKPYNKKLLNEVLSVIDKRFEINSVYQCLMNESESKFLAFYSEENYKEDSDSLPGKTGPREVTIISEKGRLDTSFSETSNQIYLYTLAGILHNKKWYINKFLGNVYKLDDIASARKKYFNTLQDSYFFKEYSTEINPDFWETYYFKKVKDITKDSSWAENSKSAWFRQIERANRDYIGMYEIVSHELAWLKQKEYKKFGTKMLDKIFAPFYKKLAEYDSVSYKTDSLDSEPKRLVYAKQKGVIINPIVIPNGNGDRILHYFVGFADSVCVYEWTRFLPTRVSGDPDSVKAVLNRQIGGIAEWDTEDSTLDDENFWNTYVLAKEEKQFKYLKKMK